LVHAYNVVTRGERAQADKARRASRSISGSASGDGAGYDGGRRRGRSYDDDLMADTRNGYETAAGRY
jgi:hypothetical protein